MKISNTLVAVLSFCIFVCLPSLCSAEEQTYVFDNFGDGVDAPVFDSAGNRLFGADYVAVLYGGVSPGALLLAKDRNGSPMSPEP